MTEKSTVFSTFSIERIVPASPARVFAAWSTREAKSRWFAGPPGWKETESEFDFRVGGREVMGGAFPDGKTSLYRAQFHDIVPNERIVYGYTMDADADRISVSVTTVEFASAGDGTTLTFTEQGVFLDGHDTVVIREKGTAELLDQLGASLA